MTSMLHSLINISIQYNDIYATSYISCNQVLKLIHEVMKQACLEGTSPSLATMLYQSSRDCLELFLAIVPVRFADVIDTVPRMGAVLYNDCCYLAHNCTLITHMYKGDLGKIDKTLQENAGTTLICSCHTFVPLIYPLDTTFRRFVVVLLAI